MNRAADIIIWIAFIIMALAVLGVMSAAAYEILTGIGVGGPSE
jgi:archaellum component FlaG (FlaF/FlaG flagellin family)